MSRTYGSRSRTEREMLKWTLTDAVYEAAIEISAASELTCTSTMSTGDEAHSDPDMHRTFRAALPPFMQADRSQFAQVQGNTFLRVAWERKMLSKRAAHPRMRQLITGDLWPPLISYQPYLDHMQAKSDPEEYTFDHATADEDIKEM